MPIINFLPIDLGDNLAGGFFNRHGGVSTGAFNSLNVSYGVGDQSECVDTNRILLKERLGLKALTSARQVHDDRILLISESQRVDNEHVGYDALITNQPGVGILIQQADCQAVVLHDPLNRVVANIHSGWRGSVANIIAKTIGRMVADFGTDPGRIVAAISPSLGPCCAEFVHFRDELPQEFHAHQVKPTYFDFWDISRKQLRQAGVVAAQIKTAAICTRCDPNYFSYRRDSLTGRCATVVGLLG